jgi:hypothetical protein
MKFFKSATWNQSSSILTKLWRSIVKLEITSIFNVHTPLIQSLNDHINNVIPQHKKMDFYHLFQILWLYLLALL